MRASWPGTSAPSDTPVGAAAVSLRGLGTGSTLTLINGRRASVASFAKGQASFIDINSIPTAAVERVEILLSGASAQYGADAVAGVVNYVLREDFDGFEVSLMYGDSTASSDNSRANVNLLWGHDGDRHQVMALVDYYEREPLFDRDRKISAESVRPSQQGFYPSFNDLFWMFYDQTEEPQDGGCAEEDFGFGNFGEYCEVNTNQYTSVLDEYSSLGGVLTYRFEMNERATWYNEFIYQETDADGTSSPANFSRAPNDPESPLWPEALKASMVEEGMFEGLEVWEDFYGYPIYAWGKYPEPRAVNVTSESMRLVSGFDWNLTDDWNLISRTIVSLTRFNDLPSPASLRRAVMSAASADGSLASASSRRPAATARSSPSAVRRTSDITRPRVVSSAIWLSGIMPAMRLSKIVQAMPSGWARTARAASE